jgi:radical SAM protein with 4Fe4S-binding SPASM domain
MLLMKIDTERFQIDSEIIVVSNERNKFIFRMNPFSIIDTNEDVVDIIELINEGLSIEEISLLKKFTEIDKLKLYKLISDLQKRNIIVPNKNFKSNVIRKSSSIYPLERLFISITENCNLRCKHCYVECIEEKNKNSEMPLDMVISCIDQAISLGAWQVDLTGGEIFCRKDIFQILDYLRSKNVSVNLFTNATMLNEEIVNKLKQYKNITRIIISFDSINKLTYEEFRQCKGSFDKLIRAIDLLKLNGIKMSFNVPFIKENQNELDETLTFLSNNYSNDIVIYPIFPLGRGDSIEKLSDMQGFVEAKKLLKKVTNIENKRFTNKLSTTCGLGESFIFIESTGEISLCPTMSCKYDDKLKIGNMKNVSLADIWETNSVINSFRKSNCKYINICSAKDKCKGGCRCKAYFESGKDLNEVDALSCLCNEVDLLSLINSSI